ncbi:unnamed protein product, partial [marine sediment metagenome]
VAKEWATIGATAFGIGAIGQIMPLVPGVKNIAKLLSTKVGKRILWGIYATSEGAQVGTGAYQIKTGQIAAGTKRIAGILPRVMGVVGGVGWLRATSGKPLTKLGKVIETKFIKPRPTKLMKVLGEDYRPYKGGKVERISKIDRYGNVYEGDRFRVGLAERDYLGRPITPKAARVTRMKKEFLLREGQWLVEPRVKTPYTISKENLFFEKVIGYRKGPGVWYKGLKAEGVRPKFGKGTLIKSFKDIPGGKQLMLPGTQDK